MSSRILVIDDDVVLAEMIGIVLQNEGYKVVSCTGGSAALTQFQEHNPDLVLLDVMLPSMGNSDAYHAIHRVSDAPTAMSIARSGTSDVVTGLEAGADDYVSKSFKPKELVVRVRARLRGREDSRAGEGLSLQGLSIDIAGHIVRRRGRAIALTPLKFDLLVTLARSPWRVFSHEELLEQVWGYRHVADTRLVNVHVQHLCSRTERDPERPELVVVIRGAGYRVGTGA